MINDHKIVALVPLRGGSKSIPKKNIKEIAGKPLCAWVLESVRAVQAVDEIYVSTEDEEIARTVRLIDSNIKILDRPSELATDEASTESVMLHFADQVKFDVLLTLQATSPLTQTKDIVNGLNKFFSDNFNSLVTGIRIKRFFWDLNGNPMNYDYKNRPRRQDFEGWIMENGAFYITDRDTLVSSQCRLGGKIGILEMSEETGLEIDEPNDWNAAENLLIVRKRCEFAKILNKMKLLVIDVDGTLTDGGMYYTEQGERVKKFNTRDAKGIELVREKGVLIALLTSEKSNIVTARAKKLQLEHVFLGIKDKLSFLRQFCSELNIQFSEIVYIGDDVNDLPVLKKVGFSACPNDAVPLVKEKSGYICKNKGGKGAVREICDLIMTTLENTDG